MDYSGKSASQTKLVEASSFGLKFIGNQLVREAFALEALGQADLESFVLVKKIVLRIGNFAIRKPPRNVRLYPPDFNKPEDETWNKGPPHIQPGPPQGSNRRTRWDIDASDLLLPVNGTRARLEINVVLGEKLRFWRPDGLPAITAKSKDAAKRLVNLELFWNKDNLAVARFHALGPAAVQGSQKVDDGYNIAMVATDEADAAFSLPLIVDPPFRNRAT